MAKVSFTKHLLRYFPGLEDGTEVPGGTVAEVVRNLDARYKGLAGYLLEDDGSLRQHVNIFLGDELIRDRGTLGDEVNEDSQIFILQALSGGSIS